MIIAINKFMNTWVTKMLKKMKKMYDAAGEPHSKGSPPFAIIYS